jgi:hypothetical protein
MRGLFAKAGGLAVTAAVMATSAAARTSEQSLNWGLLRQPPNFVESYLRGYELGRRAAGGGTTAQTARTPRQTARRGLQEAIADPDAERRKQARAQSAANMIAGGECQDARSYALTEGDLDLALQVAKLCPYYTPTK